MDGKQFYNGTTGMQPWRSIDNIFLVFRKGDRFYETSYEDEDEEGGYGDGYEFYDDDYGIRTGMPSSEIDYIVADEKSAEKAVRAVKESGLYIPVTDLDGNIIFNPCK